MLPQAILGKSISALVNVDILMKIQVRICVVYQIYMCNTKIFSDKDSMFQMYSQKSCIFECSLKFAIDSVGCLPWDFPIPTNMNGSEILVCHSSIEFRNAEDNKLIQFFEAMKNQTILRTCSCLPDCETTEYDTQESHNIKRFLCRHH